MTDAMATVRVWECVVCRRRKNTQAFVTSSTHWSLPIVCVCGERDPWQDRGLQSIRTGEDDGDDRE